MGEFKNYVSDLVAEAGHMPDLLVVATDSNCKGLRNRKRDLQKITKNLAHIEVVQAIPDPHIERWLLLDGAAFARVFKKGCSAPDRKCDRGAYKEKLANAIAASGVQPVVGGIEFAEEIARHINLRRAERADASFRNFVGDLRAIFRRWKSTRRKSR